MASARTLGLAALFLVLGCAARDSERVRAAFPYQAAGTATHGNLPPGGCVTSGPERCFDATDNNCNGVIDEGCGVDTGPVQFAIAWEGPLADVDLLVTDPIGELAEVGRTPRSGLRKQRDCPGKEDECSTGNMENVFLDAPEIPRGTYRVRIVLERLNGEDLPVLVQFGGRLGSRSFRREVVLDRVDAAYQEEFAL